MTKPATRWPLHPPPGPLESLSSWLDRLAVTYGVNRKDLVGPHNLELGGMYVPHHLDADPPPVMRTELAQRTGVDLVTLQAMTLAGWAPYLFDTPGPPRAGQAQQVFHYYVRCNSMLLATGRSRPELHRRIGTLGRAVASRQAPDPRMPRVRG